MIFWSLLFISSKNQDFSNYFSGKSIYHYEGFIKLKDDKVYYVEAGDTTKPLILFIHGSPGKWDAWKNYFLNDTLLNQFHLIAYDRPGYGKTTLPPVSSIETQYHIALKISNLYAKKDKIIVGHSYGGAVALKFSFNKKQFIKKIILVAPAICPKYQHPKWYNYFAKYFDFILPNDLISSNYEMYPLSKELEKIYNQNDSTIIPIAYIQGKKDWLVPFNSTFCFKKHFKGNIQFIIDKNENHFIPWTKPQLITKEIN